MITLKRLKREEHKAWAEICAPENTATQEEKWAMCNEMTAISALVRKQIITRYILQGVLVSILVVGFLV